MLPKISKISRLKENTCTGFLFNSIDQIPGNVLTEAEASYLKAKLEKESSCAIFRYPVIHFFSKTEQKNEDYLVWEGARKSGAGFRDMLEKEKISETQLVNYASHETLLAFLEGILLSSYSFSKYKTEKEEKSLKEILVPGNNLDEEEIREMLAVADAVICARNLVNEPLSFLTAVKFSEEMGKMAEKAGFNIEVFNKQKISSLKMGGLLAVNRGSPEPPTFNILEWKPENPVNQKPVILVGKGIVFDTGGLSLKPTQKSMDYMKCDMAGAAAVAATIYAAAKSGLSVHLFGLIPATENRPDGNAYVPGDIIKMYDGTTVEIKNTDAEGRLILADALGYAKKYDPELVVDIATLTGSADLIAGRQGMVGMGNSPEYMAAMKEAGNEVYERIIEVPLWEEYAEPLKSSVADLNNLGIREAQTTIAGKFLEHFTGYKWIHLDTAGTTFFFEKGSYQPEGGTGAGVRLLYRFLKKFK